MDRPDRSRKGLVPLKADPHSPVSQIPGVHDICAGTAQDEWNVDRLRKLVQFLAGLHPDQENRVDSRFLVGSDALGRIVDAGEALQLGIAQRLVDDADVAEVAMDIAGEVAALPGSGAAKRQFLAQQPTLFSDT